MKLEFRHKGRKVSEKQFLDGLRKEGVKKAGDGIEKRLRALRDPKTGERVKVTKTYRNGAPAFRVEGSPEAVAQAEEIMRGK